MSEPVGSKEFKQYWNDLTKGRSLSYIEDLNHTTWLAALASQTETYVLTSGEYSDYRIEACFQSLKAFREYLLVQPNLSQFNDVEIYDARSGRILRRVPIGELL